MIDQELHRGLLLTLLREMCKSMKTWTRSSAKDFCLCSLSEGQESSKDTGPGAPQRTSPYTPCQKCGEIDQELCRGLLIFFIKNARNQSGNQTGSPLCSHSLLNRKQSVRKWARSSTEDFCLSVEVYGISEELKQQLHRGLLLIFFIKRVRNQ